MIQLDITGEGKQYFNSADLGRVQPIDGKTSCVTWNGVELIVQETAEAVAAKINGEKK